MKLFHHNFVVFFCTAFLLIAVFGCGEKQQTMPVPADFFSPHFPEDKIIIQSGNILTIRFYYNPELNDRLTVRPDGKISLTMFQGLEVVGMTPDELQRHLVQLYSEEFLDPIITVNIERTRSSEVFITGEITNGGAKPLDSNTTIAQMLSQSGIIDANVALDSVFLIRKFDTTTYNAYQVDARLQNGKERDIYLAPGDIIYVPQNTITKVGSFVQKYIRDVVPPQMSINYGFTHEVHVEDTTTTIK